jgi:hypothetical protein
MVVIGEETKGLAEKKIESLGEEERNHEGQRE